MTCDARDQNLLLLAHNQLSPIARLEALWHMRSCERCRAQQARHVALSRQIAASLRPPGLAPWRPRPAYPLAAAPLGMLMAFFSTLIVIAILTTVVITTNAVRCEKQHNPPPVTCRPDLPNSLCQ